MSALRLNLIFAVGRVKRANSSRSGSANPSSPTRASIATSMLATRVFGTSRP